MIRLPQRSKLTYTLFPYTTLCRCLPTSRRRRYGVSFSARIEAGALGPFTWLEVRSVVICSSGVWRAMTFTACSPPFRGLRIGDRSEEHTSELQSLMRISYAVFCLKKKNELR